MNQYFGLMQMPIINSRYWNMVHGANTGCFYLTKENGEKLFPEVLNHATKKQFERYTCVNLTNRSTIEFRMFRGTLKRNTFIATLQMVDPICGVAFFAGSGDSGTDLGGFCFGLQRSGTGAVSQGTAAEVRETDATGIAFAAQRKEYTAAQFTCRQKAQKST